MKFVSPLVLSIVSVLVSLLSLAILSVLVYSVSKIWWNTPQNELVTWAREMYPLNGKKEYILRKNSDNFADEENKVPAGVFYYLEVPGEPEPEMQQMVSGRKIGSTDIDLTNYEGKKIKLDGYHYLGVPLFLRPENEVPMSLRSRNQAVIHLYTVNSVE